ncbi:hypothetical protein B0A50_03611 [Salinomyces thailandicus]|uniref:F-box domain-containing protein n=1 Tax=Salinomyces thailandicus TaxID=706561 RepID=A0A4U0U438_9PEZI|nr:hypothetical protein B0A50_03611 [Salinomyces thailandica]
MGLLKHFRSRSRLSGPPSPQSQPYADSYTSPTHSYRGRDPTQRLPDPILERIFAYTCPHTQDQTYEPSERSQIGDGCMLCDLRDLAHCAQACRKWYRVAQRLLYTSVRIDAVHYCALEEELAERRKKAAGKHFRSRSAVVEPGDVPSIRLSLLCRTVREQDRLADQVLLLKLPYMTRETAKGELARTVSALPNLRYVDLPEGFFTGDPSCLTLRHELQARCPDMRKMSYHAGSEEALELLAHRHWQSIEQLELNGLAVEPVTLRIVLASLPTLHHLTLSDLPWLDDTIFQPSPGYLPDFPPLQYLHLENTPHLTSHGLLQYLEAPVNRENLSTLSLHTTGITVPDLPHLLWAASQLRHLAINEKPSKSLSLLTAHQLPPLTSISLQTLHFEITSAEDVVGLQKPAESYYAYLANSLHQNALPALKTLYVRDPDFPELLLLPPVPAGLFGSSPSSRASSPDQASLRSKPSNLSSLHSSPSATTTTNYPQPTPRNLPARAPPTAAGTGFTQNLEVFSKGLDELEWLFTSVSPPTTNTNVNHLNPYNSRSNSNGNSNSNPHTRALSSSPTTSSPARPLSAYSASRGLGPQWAQGGFGGEARKSVVVGNGFGGFLAVPQESAPRPLTSDGVSSKDAGDAGWGGGGGGFLRPPTAGFMGADGAAERGRRGSRHDLWR